MVTLTEPALYASIGVLGPYAGREPQLAYVSLLIQSCRYFARTLNATHGDVELAANMSNIADTLTAKVRAQPSTGGEPYWKDYGVHASANLLSAGVPTAVERQLIAANVFNDSTSVCSFSPFNTCVNWKFCLSCIPTVPHWCASVCRASTWPGTTF